MANTKNAAIREMIIDHCLSDFKRYYSTQDIMDACNRELDIQGYLLITSMNTIRNDITSIEYRWKVVVEQIKSGRNIYYRYQDKNFSIYKSPLTEEELQQLNQTVNLLNKFQGLPQFEWINELNARFKSSFMLNAKTETVISFDENPFVKGRDLITPLFEAITHKDALEITYQPFGKEHSITNIMNPYYLKQYNGRWFLFGLENARRKLSVYSLDRIISFEVSKASYIENTTIDFASYFDDIIGISLNEKEDVEKVLLWVSAKQYPYVQTKPLNGSQRLISLNDSGAIIQINVILNYELEQLILSFGEKIKVLAPIALKEKISERIKKTFENYQ